MECHGPVDRWGLLSSSELCVVSRRPVRELGLADGPRQGSPRGPLQRRLASLALQFPGHPQVAHSGLLKRIPENTGQSASGQLPELVGLVAIAFR
jgi:hypothetical protein